jgi:hypothetical protein
LRDKLARFDKRENGPEYRYENAGKRKRAKDNENAPPEGSRLRNGMPVRPVCECRAERYRKKEKHDVTGGKCEGEISQDL